MINREQTDIFGVGGLEMNYYTEKTVESDVLLNFPPPSTNTVDLQQCVMAKTFNPIDFSGIIQQIYYINSTAERVYAAHKSYKLNDIIIDRLACEYTFGMHSFVNCVKKFFLYVVYTQCKIVGMKNGNTKLLSIEGLFAEKEAKDDYALAVWSSIFNENQNYIELFQIIDWMDSIYSGVNMYTNVRVVSPDMAAMCAVGAVSEQEVKYVFHNHSLRQVITGLDNFLQSYFGFPDGWRQERVK